MENTSFSAGGYEEYIGAQGYERYKGQALVYEGYIGAQVGTSLWGYIGEQGYKGFIRHSLTLVYEWYIGAQGICSGVWMN